MMEAKHEIAKLIAGAAGAKEEGALASLEMAKEEFGDISSRIAFSLAKEAKKNPVHLASELANAMVAKLEKHGKNSSVEKISTAGPYINFALSEKFFSSTAEKICLEKEKFGQGKETGKKIMVEFFDANTHKGVHIGHIRNISLGEAVSRMLEYSGNKVIRANYQGDIGPHVAKCLWGFINLYHEKVPPSAEKARGIWLGKVYAEASKRASESAQVEKEIQEINLKLYTGDKLLEALREKTRQWCLDDFDAFYKEFGVKFDEFYFESGTQELGMEISKDALKKGIAKIDQGATIIDLKDENLGVVIIVTKEGYPLYHTKDLGLAKLKFGKYSDLDRSIHVVGKEQEFYFMQLFRAFSKLGMKKPAEVSYHLVYELVMLPEGKMSSREGTMVLYSDLKEKLFEAAAAEVRKKHEDWNETEVQKIALEVSQGALKFSMLHRENSRVLTFDWNEALKLEGDTGPYLQYACVRTAGIINKAKEMKLPAKVATGHSYNQEERRLLKKLASFGETVEKSARDFSPSHLCSYLLDVASLFNKFYDTSRVLNAEHEQERKTRLAIVNSTNIVLNNGLSLLNIPCPDKM